MLYGSADLQWSRSSLRPELSLLHLRANPPKKVSTEFSEGRMQTTTNDDSRRSAILNTLPLACAILDVLSWEGSSWSWS